MNPHLATKRDTQMTRIGRSKPSQKTRKRTNSRTGRRRLVLEGLEPRLLLAGLNDSALLASIRTSLDSNNTTGLAAWSARLQDPTILGQSLPMIGNRLVDLYSPKTELTTLVSQLVPVYSSLADLRNGLQAIPGITVATTRDNFDNIELDVRFQTTKQIDIGVDPNQLGSVNLAIASTVNATVLLDFQLTVGAYWNGTEAKAYFGTNNDNLVVSFTLTGNSTSSQALLGFFDVGLTGVTTTMAARFGFDLRDPGIGAAADGRVTLDELSGAETNALVTTTLAATAGPTLTGTLTSDLSKRTS